MALSDHDRADILLAIASRQYKAKELANRFGVSVQTLRDYVAANREALEATRRRIDAAETDNADVSPEQLDTLWITNKYERLKRLQMVADHTYDAIQDGGMTSAEYATVIREFRSYLMLAANELGQLLHRGAGDSGTGDTLSVEINGVNLDSLR